MPPPLDSSILLSNFLISPQKKEKISFFFSFFFLHSLHFFLMVPELEKPRVTEIQVRIDCNGCVQKIKKALHGINGIYDLYIDFPQQKLIIIGWADPEKIVKAIRKTRKIATICSHTECATQEPPPPTDQPAPQEGNNTNPNEPPPPQEAANPPPSELAPPPEQAPPAEPPKDHHPPPEQQPSPGAAGHPAASGPKDVGEVHVIYHHPPDYGYRYNYGHHGYNGYWNKYHNSQGHPQEGPVHASPVPVHVSPVPPPPSSEPLPPQPPSQPQPQPQPVYVTHSYNMYTPSPYVTEYEYVRSPPRPQAHDYSRMERMHNNYDYDQNQYYYYNNGSTSSNGNITSIFSDENPNACRIV